MPLKVPTEMPETPHSCMTSKSIASDVMSVPDSYISLMTSGYQIMSPPVPEASPPPDSPESQTSHVTSSPLTFVEGVRSMYM